MKARKPASRGPAIIYGLHPVLETLKAQSRRVDRLFIAEGSAAWKRMHDNLERSGIPVTLLSMEELAEIAGSAHHQGVVAEVGPFAYAELDRVLGKDSVGPVVLLDEVQDPANLGNILRTAECLGAAAVVCTKDRSVTVTPAVEKASAGGSAHVPVVRVTNLVRAIEALKKAGYWIYSAEARGSVVCFRQDLSGRVAFVVGSEGRGVRRLVRETCDGSINIPMKGKIDSLNVSQAVTILLAEALRQRDRYSTLEDKSP